ncbi:4Fe-4S dicluster domain-containing protein [Chrysiogenes arsenatis]|uniref:4Fe-4S dicluster domain-containing protein n=1 Tax=Chrysiogenes arsenatis TaxID=309797 RepID=UPI000411EFB7|nr:4Fe-4S dicluster domain-containing protein [Chrysiogenes arsenatis]
MSALLEWVRTLLNENPFKTHLLMDQMRPPGAVAEAQFMERCIRCARCIEVCPYESIQRAKVYDKLQIGTPYIYAQERGCYLCMLCPPVCPTGALDPTVLEPEAVRIGIARIDEERCLNYLYERDELQGVSRTGSAKICNVCFNVCPLRDHAIELKGGLLPTITEKCVGCGACVEKCPTEPRSITIIPEGMVDEHHSGIHHLRTRRMSAEKSETSPHSDIYRHKELMERKRELSPEGVNNPFEFNFKGSGEVEGWGVTYED